MRGGGVSIMSFRFNLSHVTSDTIQNVQLHLAGIKWARDQIGYVRVKVQGHRKHPTIIYRIDKGDRDIIDVTDIVQAVRNTSSIVQVSLKLRYTNDKLMPRLLRGRSIPDNIFLLVFSKNTQPIPSMNTGMANRMPKPRSDRLKQNIVKRHSLADSRLCQKYDFIVDFEELGWSDAIVFPPGYNAYYCDGRCPSPVEMSYTPTTHAIIQSLYRLKYRTIPRPRCVPTKLRPLSMLYFEHDELVLRVVQDMVVEECGCR